jgi:Flp pilus assembly protein TadG
MSMVRRIIANVRGAAAIEMAFALPLLLMFIYGIFQYGVILQANAGMQHALGEGARLATIYPKPADSLIVTRMQQRLVGMKVGTFGTPAVSTPATSVCTNCRLLTVTYTVTPDFLFFNGPPISLTRTKQVYTVS